jgi:hypothetical protein
MIEPTPENPQYLFENIELEVAIVTTPTGERRFLKARVVMKPVPPPAGSTGTVLARTPWMLLRVDTAEALVAGLQEAIQRTLSVQKTPASRQ